MLQIFDIVAGADAALTVVELDSSLTPRGLSLELQVAVIDDRAVAFWMFEDGRLLAFTPMGKA